MNSDQLNERNKMIADLAVLAREMLNNVDCGDLKWCVYMNRLMSIAKGDSIHEEKKKKLNNAFNTFCGILFVFLFIMSICIAFILWIYSFVGFCKMVSGEGTIGQFLLVLSGACAITSILIYFMEIKLK